MVWSHLQQHHSKFENFQNLPCAQQSHCERRSSCMNFSCVAEACSLLTCYMPANSCIYSSMEEVNGNIQVEEGIRGLAVSTLSILSFLPPFLLPSLSPILSYPILSYPILSYPILSYPILSYPILSYPILSYPILSYPFLSFPFLFFFLFPNFNIPSRGKRGIVSSQPNIEANVEEDRFMVPSIE